MSKKPLVVVLPGLGMAARYFAPLRAELEAAGFPAFVAELRGQGESPVRASREVQWGYHDLAADVAQAIRAGKQELLLDDDSPTLLLGHSMGGQVAALFLARPRWAREPQQVVARLGEFVEEFA